MLYRKFAQFFVVIGFVGLGLLLENAVASEEQDRPDTWTLSRLLAAMADAIDSIAGVDGAELSVDK